MSSFGSSFVPHLNLRTQVLERSRRTLEGLRRGKETRALEMEMRYEMRVQVRAVSFRGGSLSQTQRLCILVGVLWILPHLVLTVLPLQRSARCLTMAWRNARTLRTALTATRAVTTEGRRGVTCAGARRRPSRRWATAAAAVALMEVSRRQARLP